MMIIIMTTACGMRRSFLAGACTACSTGIVAETMAEQNRIRRQSQANTDVDAREY
jgi:hypothetical protein